MAQNTSNTSGEISEQPALLGADVVRMLRRNSTVPATVFDPTQSTGKKGRVLLLQGPVGPFFSRLQNFLDEQGFDAWRVTFNAGDRFYGRHKKRLKFKGDLQTWEQWIGVFLATYRPDFIVLFGSDRKIHTIARAQADALGIRVIALEEGYLRPGYVTIEEGANNWLSPIAGQLPPEDFSEDENRTPRPAEFNSTFSMCYHAASYYTLRTLFTGANQRDLYHRQIHPTGELVSWARNIVLRLTRLRQNNQITHRLINQDAGKYFLVPLQVASDTQLADASMGWNNLRLIIESIRSFARSAPSDRRLVFKIHPMERGHSDDPAVISAIAQEFGVSDRVDVIDDGPLAPLTTHCAGMITMNSTSGLSAIHHGVPLLVIGRAVYAHKALATCASGTPDFDAFWHKGHVADADLRRRYLLFLRTESLKPGNFYVRKGMELSCIGVTEVMRRIAMADTSEKPVSFPLENIA